MLSLEEKLKLWVKITGVNPEEEQKSYTIYFDDRLSEYDIREMDEKIKESLKYDKTGLFAEAYLSHYFKEYINKRGFHLNEYLTNPSIKDYLKDVSLLNQALMEGDAEVQILEETRRAMEFYGLESDKLSVFDIAEIRTCANNCMNKNLRMLQFSVGETGVNGFKMSREIRMYKDLNALILSVAKGNVDGVSMAYIRDDKEITNSYFSFVIKNGMNLYLLTDKPSFVHPMQNEYVRCPGRSMSKRIEGNLFPYDTVANIDISDLWGSGRYGTKEKEGNLSTVFAEDTATEKLFETIGSIDNLRQAESFWFVLMISMIKEKFYDKDIPKCAITYSGSQIRHPAIEASENSLLVQNSLPSMSMERLAFSDIGDITFGEHYEKYYKNNWNQYLIDRYKERVSEDVLNITEKDNVICSNDNGRSEKNKLRSFNIIDECGTEEELRYRQKWIGRYNYAYSIKTLLQEDYEANSVRIYNDIEMRIRNRLQEIVILYLQNKLVDKNVVSHHTFDRVYEGDEICIGEISSFDKWYNDYPSVKYRFGSKTYYGNKSDYRCAITGEVPGVALTVKPSTNYALCQICGCEVSELDEFIQHWTKTKHYCGNPNLSNIDPLAYVLSEDPFNKMEFSFTIVLSKKEYLRLCRVAGVEEKKFWLEEKPLCLKADGLCGGEWKLSWNGNLLKQKCAKCKYYKGNAN